MDLHSLKYLGRRIGGAEVLGVDFLRDEAGDLALVHGGLALESGEAVAVADIAERVETPRETEFYDRYFGELLEDWVEDEDTPTNRLQMEMQLATAIQADPRTLERSAKAQVVEWTHDPRRLRMAASWDWITETGKKGNLVVTLDSEGVKVVREAYRPTDQAQGGTAL
jgi:hypothetical protein